jgi:NAD(P) transhydrogenase subunit beta
VSIATAFYRDHDFIQALYIVAFVCFILGLRGLSGPNTAVRGNWTAAVGMAIAFVATLLIPGVVEDGGDWALILGGIALGTAIGVPAALKVKMTAMPQMVALFNGVGGGAVALIAWAEYRRHFPDAGGALWDQKAQIPSLFAAIKGSISLWGSKKAFGKLHEILPGRPIRQPGQQFINALLALIAIVSAVVLASGTHSEALFVLGILVTAAILGNLVVLPIGGADMPVVISLLNAFTGLSAAATGIALDNTALIVAGMLVGASGSILTNQMAVAMNRSVPAIIAGGFGGGGALAAGGEGDEDRSVRSTSADDVAVQLSFADRVVIVPGYGMAVAQAQHAVAELTDELEKRGVDVEFAIHPVAGRMPGHMNVLLAEADIAYDKLKEMDDINPEFPTTDVSLVIGANDVTNPAAREQKDSPIYGMPILDVDKSQQVIVLKRSMNTGFAGIDNPLFYNENTQLLFGDAKKSIQTVLAQVKELA